MRLHPVMFLFLAVSQVQANECSSFEDLRQLDQLYEDALRVGDVTFLQQLLAENFVWVHNLAVDIENKKELISRLAQPHETVQARTSSELTFHHLDNTIVVTGLSSVKKRDSGDGVASISRYRFQRTYVVSGDRC